MGRTETGGREGGPEAPRRQPGRTEQPQPRRLARSHATVVTSQCVTGPWVAHTQGCETALADQFQDVLSPRTDALSPAAVTPPPSPGIHPSALLPGGGGACLGVSCTWNPSICGPLRPDYSECFPGRCAVGRRARSPCGCALLPLRLWAQGGAHCSPCGLWTGHTAPAHPPGSAHLGHVPAWAAVNSTVRDTNTPFLFGWTPFSAPLGALLCSSPRHHLERLGDPDSENATTQGGSSSTFRGLKGSESCRAAAAPHHSRNEENVPEGAGFAKWGRAPKEGRMDTRPLGKAGPLEEAPGEAEHQQQPPPCNAASASLGV